MAIALVGWHCTETRGLASEHIRLFPVVPKPTDDSGIKAILTDQSGGFQLR